MTDVNYIDSKLKIEIEDLDRFSDRVVTCDITHTFTFVEPNTDIYVETEDEVEVYVDNVLLESVRFFTHSNDEAFIRLQYVEGFDYEVKENDNGTDFCISVHPKNEPEISVDFCYYKSFEIDDATYTESTFGLGLYLRKIYTEPETERWVYHELLETGKEGYYIIKNNGLHDLNIDDRLSLGRIISSIYISAVIDS